MHPTMLAAKLESIILSHHTVAVDVLTVGVDKADEHLSRTRPNAKDGEKIICDRMKRTDQE